MGALGNDSVHLHPARQGGSVSLLQSLSALLRIKKGGGEEGR